MKDGWEITTLGDVCEIYQPTTLSTKDLDESGRYFVYGANGIIGKYSNYNHEDSEVILTCRGSTCGTINVSLPFSWINGNAMVVRPKGETLLKEYLKYLLRGIDYSKVITGAAQPQITRVKLAPTTISFPKSIPEQQRIVDILDQEFAKIDALKANAEKSLQAAKDLFQATLMKELKLKEGWSCSSLGSLCQFSQGLQVGVNNQFSEFKDGRVRFLRIIDFTQGKESPRYISAPDKKYYLKKDGIAMVRYGSVGYVCYGYEGVIANNLFKIDIKNGYSIRNKYLYYVLISDIVQSEIRKSVSGVALPAISFGMIRDIAIPFPLDIIEQDTIIAYLDDINNKCNALQAIYQKTVSLCDDLKQALLRKAFNGEL